MAFGAALLPLGDSSVGTVRTVSGPFGQPVRPDAPQGSEESPSFADRLQAARDAGTDESAGAARRSQTPERESVARESERPQRSHESAERKSTSDTEAAKRAADRSDSTGAEAGDSSVDSGAGDAAQAGQSSSATTKSDEPPDDAASTDEDEDVPSTAAALLASVLIDERVVATGKGQELAAAVAPVAAASARPVGAVPWKGDSAETLEVEPDGEADAATTLDVESIADFDFDTNDSPTDAGGRSFESALANEASVDNHSGERLLDGSNSIATTSSSARAVAASAASAPNAVDTAALAASNERAARVLDQIRVFVKPGMRSASLELTPANLGRVDVQLSFDRGSVTAHLTVDAIDTFEALKRHMPELRASLERGGLDVGNLDLSFAARDQSAPRDNRGEHTNTGANTRVGATNEFEGRGVETVWLRPSTLTSERVDTLA